MGVTAHQQHNLDREDHHRPFPNDANTSSYTTTINNSPGIGGEVNGYPFTTDQWKELARQAHIYKYIKESIPVPHHLLLPSSGGHGSNFNLNFKLPKNGNDLDPERCKRTDGKKWRCSRDVAPHQKYCERHLHRGRPRSRKPVEIHSNDKININNKKSRIDQQIIPSDKNIKPVESLRYLFQPDVSVSSHMELTRYLNLATEEQWHNPFGTNIGQGYVPYTNASVFQQIFFQNSKNLIPFSNFENEAFKCFVNPELMCFQTQESQIENGLTDAWSSEDPHSNESSVFSQGNLSPTSLSLSMGLAGDEMGDIQMGLNIRDTEYENSEISPVSWMGSSTPGGPLAEALRGMS